MLTIHGRFPKILNLVIAVGRNSIEQDSIPENFDFYYLLKA